MAVTCRVSHLKHVRTKLPYFPGLIVKETVEEGLKTCIIYCV